MDQAWKAGLEDVIAARSAVCQVDGEAGRLYYRGYEIGDLAAAASFEDVTRLLLFGELPSAAQRADFQAPPDPSRGLPSEIVAPLPPPPPRLHSPERPRTLRAPGAG